MSFIEVTRVENSKTIALNVRHIQAIMPEEDDGANITMPSSGPYPWSIRTVETYRTVVDLIDRAERCSS